MNKIKTNRKTYHEKTQETRANYFEKTNEIFTKKFERSTDLKQDVLNHLNTRSKTFLETSARNKPFTVTPTEIATEYSDKKNEVFLTKII